MTPHALRCALEMVSREHGVTPDELLGRSRELHIARARAALCVVLRDTFALSLPTIGRLLGRDHTTILNLLKPHQRAMRALEERLSP